MNIRESVVVALRDAADPVRAPQQQAYMKSDMPYLGVGVPQCRRIAGALFAKHQLPDADAWEAAILDLWRRAAHREERYAAVELLLFRRYSRWLEPARLPMIEEMVATGAWWDYVDAIAGRGVGAMLAAHPRPMKAILRQWARDGDIWKRRTAILAQLRAKQETDPNLLADAIRPSIGHPEFFLRKGIGWALREYSKTDPGWVTAFVDAHPGLSALSRREALKHLERQLAPGLYRAGGWSGRIAARDVPQAEEMRLMGEMVEFAANGTTARGYLAAPGGGSGPGVIVLQEWWGLVPQIKAVCDLFAGEGFAALAPDLYHGEMAEHTEMDKAGELMTTLPPERAARDMSAAIDYLLDHDACSTSTVGVAGFCMGGLLTLRIAALAGDRVSAAAPFYGAPLGDDTLDWSNLSAKVEGHMAASDDFFPPDACEALAQQLRDMGKDVVFHVYEGTGHGFGNWENPLGTYNEPAWNTARTRTLDLLRANVT